MKTIWLFFATLLLIMHSVLLSALREHQVHNIVLYPDEHSWCKTSPIKQVETWPYSHWRSSKVQCSSQELNNNICVGACFSYTVPHNEPSAPSDIRPYCDFCQPLHSDWHTVTLNCTDEENNSIPIEKKVQIITNCSCSSCIGTSNIEPAYNTSLQSLTEMNLDVDNNVLRYTSNLRKRKTTEKLFQLFTKLKETGSQKVNESRVEELFSDFKKKIDLEELKEMIKQYNQEKDSTSTVTIAAPLSGTLKKKSTL